MLQGPLCSSGQLTLRIARCLQRLWSPPSRLKVLLVTIWPMTWTKTLTDPPTKTNKQSKRSSGG